MNTKKTYTLTVGEGYGSERLKILNECYNPFSLKFLEDIDLRGKIVLEVACGIGLFTCELAKLVGKNGKVIATDISHEQLEIAKKNARKQNLDNIEFIQCSALKLDSLKIKVNCVYSRLLLVHLPDPVSALKQELNCLKPGGYLICSEPPFSYEPMSCYPKSETFNKAKEIHFAQTKMHNTDFSLGIKLPHLLKELGTSLVYSYIGQPILDTPRKKSQLRLGLHELSKHLISGGFITKNELELLSEELKKIEQDDYIVAHPPCMETCVKKC